MKFWFITVLIRLNTGKPMNNTNTINKLEYGFLNMCNILTHDGILWDRVWIGVDWYHIVS